MPDAKIKSKDLTYEAALPPFLQRLHAQKAGRSGDPDRHEHQVARPKRAKARDEDDGPTVVDESGELLGKGELEKMNGGGESIEKDSHAISGGGEIEEAVSEDKRDEDGEKRAPEQKTTDGVAVKKRKVAKVVGEDDEDSTKEVSTGGERAKPIKKAKKKAKPIKLAFEEDEGP